MVQRAILATRLAVRRALADWAGDVRDRAAPEGGAPARPPLVLVGLSGGADSLALAAAVAHEAPRAAVRAGAVIVDHGLQEGSAGVAAAAAQRARELGLDPVLVRRVEGTRGAGDGPEGAARAARYRAFSRAAAETGARAILTAHTRDDQAEQVLLALARGSGSRSVAGIPPRRELRLEPANGAEVDGAARVEIVRPFLWPDPEITRAITAAACAEAGLEAWRDPHNSDHNYARVRVRETVLPVLARELGERVRAGLARTADLARADADALDEIAARLVASEARADEEAGAAVGQAAGGWVSRRIAIPIRALEEQPEAVRARAIRMIVDSLGGACTLEHTRAVSALVTRWRGQGPIEVEGVDVARDAGELRFSIRGCASGDEAVRGRGQRHPETVGE